MPNVDPETPAVLHRRLPVLLALCLLLFALVLLPTGDWYDLLVVSELGVIENGTVLVALIGAAYAGLLFRKRSLLPHPAAGWWYLCFCVGLLWLSGEEISWGQQWFQWATPADYAAINKQGETNLHNLNSWTEQVPKLALSGGVLLTGILWPLYARLKGRPDAVAGGWLGRIWPTPSLWPSAAIAFGLYLLGRVPIWLALDPDAIRRYVGPLKEGHELFLILFVTLYLRCGWLGLAAAAAQRATAGRGEHGIAALQQVAQHRHQR